MRNDPFQLSGFLNEANPLKMPSKPNYTTNDPIVLTDNSQRGWNQWGIRGWGPNKGV